MAELMLLNPAKRPTKRRRKGRALAKGRASRKTRARKNPATRAVMRVSAASAKRRRARRNPIGLSGGGLMSQVMQAAQGAAGALAVDAVMTYVPLPAMLTTGTMRHVTKAGLAIALGLVGKKFLGRAAGRMAEGAMTVAAYSAAKEALGGVGMNLAGVGYVSPAQSFLPGMAEYINPSPMGQGVGEYVPNYGGY